MTKMEEEGTLFFQLWRDYPEMGKKLGENIAVELTEVKGRVPTVGGEIVPLIIGKLEEEEGLVPEEARAFAPPLPLWRGEEGTGRLAVQVRSVPHTPETLAKRKDAHLWS